MTHLEFSKPLRSSLIASLLLVALAACQKHEPGPAEQVGKEIDNAAAKASEQIEKAGDRVKGTAKDATREIDKAVTKVGQEVEQAGVHIQQSAKDESPKNEHK